MEKCMINAGRGRAVLVVLLCGAWSLAWGQATDVECMGCVDGNDIANFTIGSNNLRPEAVTGSRIAPFAVSTDKIRKGAVIGDKLAPLAVSTDKIRDRAVTAEKIQTNAVGARQVDPTQVQFRVTRICEPGSYMAEILGSGLARCESGTFGNGNTRGGYRALINATGRQNTAFGDRALTVNTIGAANTAVGWNALLVSNGSGNTALGSGALTSNTSGSSNLAVGAAALWFNTEGSNNVALGEAALLNLVSGNSNIAIGNQALLLATSGDGNFAAGDNSLRNATIAAGNTAVGHQTLMEAGRTLRNTAVGYNALRDFTGNTRSTTSGDNTAVGHEALMSTTIGDRNTALGGGALRDNLTGESNTAIGISALQHNLHGFGNIAIGNMAGGNYDGRFGPESNNIVIGSGGLPGESDTIRIGKSGTRSAFIGGIYGSAVTSVTNAGVFVDSRGQLGTIRSSARYKEAIADMGESSTRLLKLRPVTFRYRQASAEGDKPLHYGLIAEQVAEVFPELVIYDDEGRPETVKYHMLSSLLLNELQKQEALIKSQSATIEEMKQQLVSIPALKAEASLMREMRAELSALQSLMWKIADAKGLSPEEVMAVNER